MKLFYSKPLSTDGMKEVSIGKNTFYYIPKKDFKATENTVLVASTALEQGNGPDTLKNGGEVFLLTAPKANGKLKKVAAKGYIPLGGERYVILRKSKGVQCTQTILISLIAVIILICGAYLGYNAYISSFPENVAVYMTMDYDYSLKKMNITIPDKLSTDEEFSFTNNTDMYLMATVIEIDTGKTLFATDLINIGDSISWDRSNIHKETKARVVIDAYEKGTLNSHSVQRKTVTVTVPGEDQ